MSVENTNTQKKPRNKGGRKKTTENLLTFLIETREITKNNWASIGDLKIQEKHHVSHSNTGERLVKAGLLTVRGLKSKREYKWVTSAGKVKMKHVFDVQKLYAIDTLERELQKNHIQLLIEKNGKEIVKSYSKELCKSLYEAEKEYYFNFNEKVEKLHEKYDNNLKKWEEDQQSKKQKKSEIIDISKISKEPPLISPEEPTNLLQEHIQYQFSEMSQKDKFDLLVNKFDLLANKFDTMSEKFDTIIYEINQEKLTKAYTERYDGEG